MEEINQEKFKPDFNVFVGGSFFKKSGNPKDGILVGGTITTEEKDVDGEEIVPIDWEYIDKGFGKIKFEHDVFKGPKAIIGFPTKRIQKNGRTEFEGRLISFDPDLPEEKLTPQQQLAKEVWGALRHIEEYNSTNPPIPQRAGWSIEGYRVKNKSLKNGKTPVRVVNFVFTTEPRNLGTEAKLLKSMSGGTGLYGITPATQTGWGAIRKESIDGSTKHKESNNKSNKKGEKKMFQSASDFYKSCKEDKGMTHEDALKATREWEEAQEKDRQDQFEKAEKSLKTSNDKLLKSLSIANEVEGIEADLDTKPLRKSLNDVIRKSVRSENGEIDVEEYLETVAESNFANTEGLIALNEKVDKLAKSLSTFVEAMTERADAEDFIRKSLGVNTEQLTSVDNGIRTLVEYIKKSLTAKKLSTDGITVEDPNVDTGKKNEDEEWAKVTKSQKVELLDKLVEEKKLDSKELIRYETTGSMNEETEKLAKSLHKELNK